MFSGLLPLYPLVVPFLLVLFRVMGLFAFVPFYYNTAIPGNVKAMLALAITFCIWNIVPHTAAIPQNLPALVIAIAGELTVGLLIGLMLAAVFSGIQIGAHLISQQMGLSLATLYNPAFEDQSTVIEQVAFWIALVIFLAIGGHREIVNAVVYSYRTVPMGGGGIRPEVMLTSLCGALDASFHAAARIGMPALVAFFIGTLVTGLMSRSMPQMNLMTMSIAVHLIVGFFMVFTGLAGWALVSRECFQDLFTATSRILNL